MALEKLQTMVESPNLLFQPGWTKYKSYNVLASPHG